MKKNKNNSKGLISIDFIFALCVSLGFISIIFAFTLTLFVVEITQYIAYASARNYMAAHIDKRSQENQAKQKYLSLINSPVIKNFFQNGWFEIDEQLTNFNFSNVYSPLVNHPWDGPSFDGVRINLIAKILGFNIIFLGDTYSEDEPKNVFTTYVNAFLTREPTQTECKKFMSKETRFRAINNLDSRFNNPLIQDDAYINIEDNGC